MTIHRHQARVRLHEWIVARQRGEGAAGPERGDRAVDQTRVQPRGAREVESQLLDDAGAQALDEDVGARDEALEDLEAALALAVQRQALLVAVQRHEQRALAAPVGRGPRARVVAAAGPLDLDHVGAHVTERLRAERTGDVLRQVDDDDSVERQGHGRECSSAGGGRRAAPRRGSTASNYPALPEGLAWRLPDQEPHGRSWV